MTFTSPEHVKKVSKIIAEAFLESQRTGEPVVLEVHPDKNVFIFEKKTYRKKMMQEYKKIKSEEVTEADAAKELEKTRAELVK